MTDRTKALEALKRIEHEIISTRGLICIDRHPSEVSKEWIVKNSFELDEQMKDEIETIRAALTEPENIPHFTIDDILMKLNTLGSTHVAKKDVYNYISGDSLALEKYVGDPEPVIPDAALKQEKVVEVTDRLIDGAYLDGAKAGWNAALNKEDKEFSEHFSSRIKQRDDSFKIIDKEKVTK